MDYCVHIYRLSRNLKIDMELRCWQFGMIKYFIFKYDMQNWKWMVWNGDNVVGLIDVPDASMVLINKIVNSIWILRWIVFGKQLVDLMNEI